ncbi:MAG: D-cysteine desulfhydrase family protein [Pseudomonadota bacterium]
MNAPELAPWLHTTPERIEVIGTQFSPAPLGFTPTPLHPLDRLSEELGGPRIWLKRDDCTGLATGGNKTRKLEYLLGEALSLHSNTVITFGAIQSNHARQTAAACARYGLACHVVLSRRVPNEAANYESGGNVLLNRMLGAEVHILENDSVDEYTSGLVKELEKNDETVYLIPPGGSNAIGALGYANCAQELHTQFRELNISPQHVFHASASSGTQAGLIYGFGFYDPSITINGINVFHPNPQSLQERIDNILNAMQDQFKPAPTLPQIHINHAYFGDGYGIPTPETLAALNLLATTEGILFDPVYSGKALAGLIDQVTLGNLSSSSDVVLIHTGGAVALNVYEESVLG